jgi:Tol biopolymer transport system component
MSQDNTRIGLVGFDRAAGRERDLSWLDWSLAADISNDGGSILFTEMSTGVGGNYTVYTRDTDGSPAVRLGEGWAAGFSADGKWALSIARGATPALVLLPTGPGAPRTLPRGRITNFGWASLFPDGRRVLLAGQESGHGPRLYVQDLEGGEPGLVGPEEIGAGYFWNPISPDGRRAVIPGTRGEFGIRSLGPESSPAAQAIESGEHPIGWTRDGRGLYVFRQDGRRAEIKLMDLDTGMRMPLRLIESQDPAGLIHFGPVLVTPDGSAFAYNYFRILSDLYVVEGLN